MTNNFSTLKLNQAVEKFTYIRFEPARYVNSDLTSIGGGKYTINLLDFNITQVQQNGIALSEVQTTPSSGEYYFNELTGLLTIYPTATPSASVAIVVFHYLFFSSGGSSIIPEDPENTSTQLKHWKQRIIQSPPIENSIKNILAGVLTINSSSVSLINDSYDLNTYFGINDSWYQKEVKVWTCIDSSDNIQKVFEGIVTNVNVTAQSITIGFEDLISKFSTPALFGDDRSETYINKEDYPNIDSNKANSPIRMIFGTVSRYQTIPETVTNLTTAEKLDPTSLFEAYCVDYSPNISTTSNREWIACRTVDGYADFSCTPSNVNNTDPNYTRMTLTAGQIAKFHIGDTFVMNGKYLRVYYVDRVNNYIYTTKDAGVTTGDSILASKLPSVVLSDKRDSTYYLMDTRDYSITQTTTTGGNKLYKIVLTNNFEANHPGLTALNVGTHSIYYRMKPDITNAKHGSVIKEILEKLGLTVNSTSISNANTSLTSNVNFTVPQFDETDYNEYFRYLELILSSSFGYIFLNNSFEIEYKLFDSPSSTTALTDTDILDNSFSLNVDYKDIITQLIAYNSHYSANEVINQAATPSVTIESIKSKHLHGIDRTVRFRHVLEDMSARLQDIMNFRAERSVLYNFETANRNLDSLIGDDYNMSNSGLLGTDTSRVVKIIKINKNNSRVSMTAIDLIGV